MAISGMKLVLKYLDSHQIKSTLSRELIDLKRMMPYLQDMEDKMAHLYAGKYPKKCNTCGKEYRTRAEYLAGTKKVSTPTSPGGSVVNNKGVLEFRNCKCGSTLLILLGDRRDESEFGKRRRQIFNECVNKVIEKGLVSEQEAVEVMRELFRYFIRFYTGRLYNKIKKAS